MDKFDIFESFFVEKIQFNGEKQEAKITNENPHHEKLNSIQEPKDKCRKALHRIIVDCNCGKTHKI